MVILGIELLCIFILAMILSTIVSDERKKQKQNTRSVTLDGYWNGAERRSAERLGVSLQVKYATNGKTTDVKSVDISTKGLRLILDEKIEKGTLLRLEIKVPDFNRLVKATGEVVWSNESSEAKGKAGKRLFSTGVKFLKFDKEGEKKLFDFIYSLKPQKP